MRRIAMPLVVGATILLSACDSRSPQSITTTTNIINAVSSCVAGQLNESEILNVTRTPAEAPLDATGLAHYAPRNATADPSAVLNSGACATNTAFKTATGVGDITGPIGANMSGYADAAQVAAGILDRQHARAFAFESACASRSGRAMLIQTDLGLAFHAVRQGVIDTIAADSDLASRWNQNNVLINASHSHATAAGQSHFDAFHILTNGADPQSYQATIDGIMRAVRHADSNLQSATPGKILFNQGELLNGTVNRSAPAYAKNPVAERNQFLDTRGEEVRTNRMMTLLKMLNTDGSPKAMLNWYPIHGTSIWKLNLLLAGDNKGYAAYRFEQDFGTDYFAPNTFLAGFMQADEGDNSPNLFITDLTEAEIRDSNSPGFRARGGGRTEDENALISGYKQYKQARDLFDTASEEVTGEVTAQSIFIDFSTVEVTNPRTYPTELQPDPSDLILQGRYLTCKPALGISFPGGAEDGRAPTAEGQTCLNTSSADVETATNELAANIQAGSNGAIPPFLGVPAGCDNPAYDGNGYACHEEKPILFPVGEPSPVSSTLPAQTLEPLTLKIQIIVVGNVAIIGLPWEVTTMSGRRVRNAVLDVLETAGVDYAVISGLSNGYIHYMTTREEYSSQQYEGASTVYGPWTQEAAEQELERLAGHIKANTVATSPHEDPGFRSTPSTYVNNGSTDDGSPSGPFGTVVVQPNASYQLDPNTPITVSAEFIGGNPRNDLQHEASYIYIEQQQTDGTWQVYKTDNDWFTRYEYRTGQSDGNHAVVNWIVSGDTPAGMYRIRHEGSSNGPTAYSGTTNAFEVLACP